MAKTRRTKPVAQPEPQESIPFSLDDDVTHAIYQGHEFDLHALSGIERETEAGEQVSAHVRHVRPINPTVAMILPERTKLVHWRGLEFDLEGLHADGAGKPTTEYEDRVVNGEKQVWKREPGGEWERCKPCEESR